MAKTKAFTLEYQIRSSPLVLYNFLTTPAGLAQWFADSVDNTGNHYIFSWNNQTDEAELISTEDDDFIRFRWEWQDEHEYFEFRIDKTEITNDTILTITDFAEPNEIESQKRLWNSQIHQLIRQIGAA